MPVYDYACTVCGRTVEVIHGVHAHGPSTCEACGAPMRKLLSPPAIVFKGSGWAKKDARAASHGASGKRSTTSASTPGGASGSSAASEGSAGTSAGGGAGTAGGGPGTAGETGGSGAS